MSLTFGLPLVGVRDLKEQALLEGTGRDLDADRRLSASKRPSILGFF